MRESVAYLGELGVLDLVRDLHGYHPESLQAQQP
jgi:hypothetical protein